MNPLDADVKPRVKLPPTAKAGELIEVKTLISHPMDNGMYKNAQGQRIPRKIINRFTCKYNGKIVLDARLEPAIAANPFFSFFLKASESGTVDFAWVDDDGTIYRASETITVT
jgi:sulfur-oxidizing protein SoxZ